MKKLFAIVVVAMFGFAFGCGATPPAVETPEVPEVPEVETPDAPDATDATEGGEEGLE
jgi:hypothetical protein